MELYGLGDKVLVDNWETIQQPLDPLQSRHLQEDPTGNKLLLDINIQQQLKLMEHYGLGVLAVMGS